MISSNNLLLPIINMALYNRKGLKLILLSIKMLQMLGCATIFRKNYLSVSKLAATTTVMSGAILVADRLSRVSGMLVGDISLVTVTYNLKFGFHRDGLPTVCGSIKTQLPLACNRCLGTMNLDVNGVFSVLVAKDDKQAEKYFNKFCKYDVITAENGNIVLEDFLEDEVILEIPALVSHTNLNCQMEMGMPSLKEDNTTKDNDTCDMYRPFSKLQSLISESNE